MSNLLPYFILTASILPTGEPIYYKLNQPTLTINEDNQSQIDDALLSVSVDDSTGFSYYTFDGSYFDGDLFNLVLDVSNNVDTLNHIAGYYILLDYQQPVVDNYYFDYIYKPYPNGSYVSRISDDMQNYVILPNVEMTELTFELSYNGTFTLGIKVGYIVNNGNYASESEFDSYLSYLEDYFNQTIFNDYSTLYNEYANLQNNFNNLSYDYNTLINNYNNLLNNYINLENSYNGLTYSQIYDIGYNKGLSDGNGESGVIMSLFTAVASVPLAILNSVMGPTLFGVPIVSILLTFLTLALILWLIRRFI